MLEELMKRRIIFLTNLCTCLALKELTDIVKRQKGLAVVESHDLPCPVLTQHIEECKPCNLTDR